MRALHALCVGLCLTVSSAIRGQSVEAEFYALEMFTPPDDEVIEVGGLAWFDDTDLLVSTRRGRVWHVRNAVATDPTHAKWSMLVEGLHEGLGLYADGSTILVLQRGELSHLGITSRLIRPLQCTGVTTIATGWGMSGNYHEFAFGLPRDREGNFYAALNLGFYTPEWWHGVARAPDRGTIIRIAPDGSWETFARGVRSPAGLGFNTEGDLFYTDNQGDWIAACPVFHVEEGDFFAHPASLRWTAAYGDGARVPSSTQPPESPPRKAAAVWLPYKWSRSAGNLVCDTTAGDFGPFGGQMFVTELTNGRVLRVQMEKVRGQYQGAAFPFRKDLGSAFRAEFGPDGTMVLGYTNRGWGGRAPAHGLARLRWTGKTPFEVHSVALQDEGFALRFTQPVDPASLDAAQVVAETYDYNWWWEYGSPPQRRAPVRVLALEAVAGDPTRAVLKLEGLSPARVAKVVLRGVRSAAGRSLLHDEFHYTINQMPSGPLTELRVNRLVEPPPEKGGQDDGWLHLTWGDATQLWDGAGWKLCDVDLDPEDPTRVVTRIGNGALVNTGADDTAFVSHAEFGSCDFRFKFMLPRRGVGHVRLHGSVDLTLTDDGQGGLTLSGPGFEPVSVESYQGAGAWHDFSGRFVLPEFDTAGTETSPARFEELQISGMVAVDSARISDSGIAATDPLGRMSFRGRSHGLCLGDVRIKPASEVSLRDASASARLDLMPDVSLSEWTREGAATWELADGVLRAKGGAGSLARSLPKELTEQPRSVGATTRLRVRGRSTGTGGASLLLGDTYRLGLGCSPNARRRVGTFERVGSEPKFQTALTGATATDLIPAGARFDLELRLHRPDLMNAEVELFVNGARVVHTVYNGDDLRHGDSFPIDNRLQLEIDAGTQLELERLDVEKGPLVDLEPR